MVLKKRFIFIFAMAFLVIFSSCSKDPKEMYLSYSEKLTQSNIYKIVYDVKYPLSESSVLGVFKKDDKLKFVTEIKDNFLELLVTSSIYNIPNLSITCIKMEGYNDYSCASGYKSDTTFTKFKNMTNPIFNLKDNTNIVYLGSRKIAERECDYIEITGKNISELSMYHIDSDKQTVRYGICYDKKTGLPLIINISSSKKSELVEKEIDTDIISMKAISFTESVDDNVFEIPIDFLINGNVCDKNHLVVAIDAYKAVDRDLNAKIVRIVSYDIDTNQKEILNEITLVNSIKKGRNMVEINYTNDDPSVIEYKICLGDKCQDGYCRVDDSGIDISCFRKSQDRLSCESDNNCYFENDICLRTVCESFHIKDECESKELCTWQESQDYDYSYCTQKL